MPIDDGRLRARHRSGDDGHDCSGVRPRRAVGNAFLMQFQADMLGVPVIVPEITETIAAGAAYLAGLAVGFWNNREEIAARRRPARRYEPRMSGGERTRLYQRWIEAVERTRGWADKDS